MDEEKVFVHVNILSLKIRLIANVEQMLRSHGDLVAGLRGDRVEEC